VDTVTQIISVRARQTDGLQNMLATSVVGHLALIALVALVPGFLTGPQAAPKEENVMTISLGGAVGPRTGMTTIGGRPIQQEVPVEAKKAIEPVRPPAARAPEMIEPKKAAPKKSETKAPEAKDPKGRTPTKGDKVEPGASVADTNTRGQGFGLSQGGAGGAGGYLDVADFCCPEYLATMRTMIINNWQSRQQARASATVKFVIQRDGRLTNATIEKSSGYATLDYLAQRAVIQTMKVPPLPAEFPNQTLTVYLIFEYQP
jgi:TonB family protein